MSREKQRGNEEEKETSLFREVLPYVIILAAVLAFRVVFLINATIPSESMENTIMTHTRVMGLKCSYWFSEPQRGDIIVFDAPDEPGTAFVKRVIAVEGDTISVIGGVVTLNGEVLDEPYLKEEMDTDDDFGPVTVPEGCVFCMGDNRNNSLDARYWENTWVTYGAIVGKVYFTYWPKFTWIADSAGDTFRNF